MGYTVAKSNSDNDIGANTPRYMFVCMCVFVSNYLRAMSHVYGVAEEAVGHRVQYSTTRRQLSDR
jgi:hypothetical protein